MTEAVKNYFKSLKETFSKKDVIVAVAGVTIVILMRILMLATLY